MGWTSGNGPASGAGQGKSADHQVDRRRLKRQVVLWRSLALIVATVLATLLALRFAGDGVDNVSGPYIARLPITGVIQTDQALLDRIETLGKSGDVRAVILQIDSPGGTYAGAEALYTALRQLAETKPVAAVLGGVAASGGYMAALAADHIVARAGSITGSVGVIMQMPRLKGLMDSLGVSMDAVRSGPLKATPSPFEEPSEASLAATRSIVDDLFNQFFALVAERRPLSGGAADTVRSGRVFTGRQALPLGLIDAVGGTAEARDWLVAEHGVDPGLTIREVEQDDEDEVLQQIIKRFGVSSWLPAQPSVDGPWAIWHPTF